MNVLKFNVVALAFVLTFAQPAAAQWQTPLHSVPVGKGSGNTGFNNAVPGAAGIPLVSRGPTIDPAFAPASNAGIAAGVANTMKGSLDGAATSDIALVSCTAAYQITQWIAGVGWQCGVSPVLPSRATAATLNLSAFSAVRTMGYALPGDGGGAGFAKTVAPLTDSFISAFTIQGGAGCTNGTYGAPSGTVSTVAAIWSAPGRASFAVGTATVAGNVLTAVNITGTPGNAYSVGDVLTSSFAGCSSQPAITVTAITAPQASFIDAVATKFQYVPDGFPNVLQFGAKGDWNGSDAGATNNFTAVQAASNFAGFKSSTSFDSGGWWGGKVIVPSGSYMMCGSTYHVLPEGTVMEGPSASGSATLRLCDAYNLNIAAFTICDPVWGFACLGTKYKSISFSASRSVAVAGGVFMIYSNNLQDFAGLEDVYVYAGQRGCVWFEKGYGGASWVGVQKVSCNAGSPNNPMMRFGNTAASGMNFGSSIISIRDIVLGGASSAPFQLQSGMQIYGGFAKIENVHCELINLQCIYVESPATGNAIIMHFTNINSQGCSGSCSGIITLASTNDPGNVIFSQIPQSTYTHVIENAQPGGVSFNVTVKLPIICDTACHN